MGRYSLLIKNLTFREIKNFGIFKLLSVWLILQIIGLSFVGNLVPLPKLCLSRVLEWGILATFLINKFLSFACFITYNLVKELKTLFFFSASDLPDYLTYLGYYLFVLTVFDVMNYALLLAFFSSNTWELKVFCWNFFSNLIFIPSLLFFSSFTSVKSVLGSLIFLTGASISLWSSLINWHTAAGFAGVCLGLSSFMGYISYQALVNDDRV